MINQLAHEEHMLEAGVARYRAMQTAATEAGRHTETASGARLLKIYTTALTEAMEEATAEQTGRGRPNMYRKLLKGVKPEVAAMLCMNAVITGINSNATVTSVARKIGGMIEDELRFSRFEIEKPDYYNSIIADLDRRNSNAYRHRHRVLVHSMNKMEIQWTSWTDLTQINVGLLLLKYAEECGNLFKRENRRKGKQTVAYLVPTDEAQDWIEQHGIANEWRTPDRMPCVEAPLDWTDHKTGGFHSETLQKLTPLVKVRGNQQRAKQLDMLNKTSMPTLLTSVNAMQQTGWRINGGILETLMEVTRRNLAIGMPASQPYEIPASPIEAGRDPATLSPAEAEAFTNWKHEAAAMYTLEQERRGSINAVARAIRMAKESAAMDVLYFVYQLDFRGRTYSTVSGVSPQGMDISKSLLEFSRAEVMGDTGWHWFQVHGANKFGNDKGSYDERVAWVQENRDYFIAAGNDPMSHVDVWSKADKPYQFLAWCMEFARAHTYPGGPTCYPSSLPVALDGSCNGLQHFSAMLRDAVGGKSVNLTPGPKPSDIYQDVADVVARKLDQAEATEHVQLLRRYFRDKHDGKISRKLTKRPVMVLPYGGTRQSCTNYVLQYLMENDGKEFFDKELYNVTLLLTGFVWVSISEVVIAARGAMDWLQKAARVLAKDDAPITYITPTGFPMVQHSPNYRVQRVAAQIGGRLMLQVKEELPGVDGIKAASGSAPNFVHSIDATHMHMTVAAAKAEGMTSFAMIHDDFGVHACHVGRFQQIIREQFVKLHSDNHVLRDFKDQHEALGIELPDLPPTGDLCIEDVLKSPYFFG